jgi:fatty acid desaturase
MPQAVLALGGATVTAAGCVWYLPALADLRAGDDRPLARRSAAAACLSGWATTGIVAALLLVCEGWWTPSGAALAGLTVTLGLRARAAVQRRRETREAARDWAALGTPRPPQDTRRARNVVVGLIGLGLAAAVAAAALAAVAASGGGVAWWTVAAVPAALVGLFLALAVVLGRMPRQH